MDHYSALPNLQNRPPKTKVYIHEHSLFAKIGAWKLKESRVALTIGNHIFLYHVSRINFLKDATWVAHELAHVRQFKKYGRIRFLFLYLWESCRKGYYQNRWEIEARDQSKDLSILDSFCFI